MEHGAKRELRREHPYIPDRTWLSLLCTARAHFAQVLSFRRLQMHSVTETDNANRQGFIPSHIGWPLFVIGLLVMSLITVTVTVVAANSDGGVEIIENSPYSPD